VLVENRSQRGPCGRAVRPDVDVRGPRH
jgi:hypothetical protein